MSAQEHRNKRSQSLRTPSRELTQLTELSTITEAVHTNHTTGTTRTQGPWISLQTNPGRHYTSPVDFIAARVSYPSCSVKVNGNFILVNCRNATYRYDIVNNAWQFCAKCEEKKKWARYRAKCGALYDDDDDDDDYDDYDDIDISAMNKEAIIYHLCNAHHEDHQGNIFAMLKDLNSNGSRLNSREIIPAELKWCRTAALYLEEYDTKHVPNIDPTVKRPKHRFFCTRDITQADMWRTVFVDQHMDIVHHGVVYIPSQRRMLFFGGRTKRDHGEAIDTIREYDLNKQAKHCGPQTWSIVNEVKLPCKMFGFGYILTADEQHIVIFGGDSGALYSDKILVIDLARMNIAESRVKCPDSGTFRAISAWENNDKLVTGFIRTCGMEIPPELCNFINLYYKEEYVHLMSHQLHWKMNIKQIISSTFDIGAD